MRIEPLLEQLREARVVPVVTVDDAEQAEATARALAAGGLHCIEIAFRSEAAADAIRRISGIDGVIVGAGTVLSPAQAEAAHATGARFAVSPGLNESVVEACAALELPFFPGVATPSDIERARGLGLRVLKVFPVAQLGGPGFVRAVSAPYPDVRFIPTGGITRDTVGEYLALPSVLACGGSWMVKQDLLRAGRFDEVMQLARDVFAVA